MLKTAGSVAAISILGGIPLSVSAKDKVAKVSRRNRKKIMVIGAHPDDPETAAGGTMCLLSDAGHEVLSVYLTRGEAHWGKKGRGADASPQRPQQGRHTGSPQHTLPPSAICLQEVRV